MAPSCADPTAAKQVKPRTKQTQPVAIKRKWFFIVLAHRAATNWQLQFVNTNLLDTPSKKLHYNTYINLYGDSHLPKFEECLQRLEKIVHELEKGDAPLEKSLTLFEEGMQLSAACRKELEQAEGKVEILLKQNGKLQAVAFESQTERTPASR